MVFSGGGPGDDVFLICFHRDCTVRYLEVHVCITRIMNDVDKGIIRTVDFEFHYQRDSLQRNQTRTSRMMLFHNLQYSGFLVLRPI